MGRYGEVPHRPLRLAALIRPAVREVGVAALAACTVVGARRPGILLLQGHMRSGSTLLMHILISHPAIIGSGERNVSYATPRDFYRLELGTRFRRQRFLSPCRYVADQVNHNRFLTDAQLLNDPRVRSIFLIREPAAALASMVEVLGPFYKMTAEDALTYYADRLAGLSHLGASLKHPGAGAFLTYDDLVHRTEPTLRSLKRFLGLDAPLSEQYRSFDFTGHRGDPSDRIRAGRILRNLPRRAVRVHRDLLERAESAYETCLRTLAAGLAPLSHG